jgi:hypothetical protein
VGYGLGMRSWADTKSAHLASDDGRCTRPKLLTQSKHSQISLVRAEEGTEHGAQHIATCSGAAGAALAQGRKPAGGPWRHGRCPRLNPTRHPPWPERAGKRPAPMAGSDLAPSGKRGLRSAPSTDTSTAPAPASHATPTVAPTRLNPARPVFFHEPLPRRASPSCDSASARGPWPRRGHREMNEGTANRHPGSTGPLAADAKKSHRLNKNWTRAGAEAVKKGPRPGVKVKV